MTSCCYPPICAIMPVRFAAAALSMIRKVGLTLPDGVGPVIAEDLGTTYFKGDMANPYHLDQQMRKMYGNPQVVNTSSFPAP